VAIPHPSDCRDAHDDEEEDQDSCGNTPSDRVVSNSHSGIESGTDEEPAQLDADPTPFQFKLPKETTKKSEFLIKHI
jgi:hypothetical protein